MNAREAKVFVAEHAARMLSLRKNELIDLARSEKRADTINDEKLIASAVNKLIDKIVAAHEED